MCVRACVPSVCFCCSSAPATAQALANRWSALLAVAVQRAFAATLLHLPLEGELQDGEAPACSDLLADARFLAEQDVSRMPPR